MEQSLIFLTVLTAMLFSFASACVNPEVTPKSFTTQDATIVSHIAYISEFSVTCSSGQVNSLYAELDDSNVIPVAIIGQQSYQVSWTEDSKLAKSGYRTIRVFDEDGYMALRKALRSGEASSSVEPFFTVSVQHPGAYSGPWVKSEFVAAVVALLVSYFAITTRTKIVS